MTRQITLGQMIDRIEDELSRNDLRPQVKKAIQDAIKKQERRFHHFTERRHGRISLVAGQTWYHELGWARDSSEEQGGLSVDRFEEADEDGEGRLDDYPWSFDEPIFNGTVSDIIKIHMVRMSYGSAQDWYPLEEKAYRDFEYLRSGTGRIYGRDSYGRRVGESWAPDFWCIYGHQIGVYPTPNQQGTLLISATARPFMPTDEGHCCVFFDEAEELIRCEAKERIYRHVIRDTQSAEEMKREAAIAARDLTAESSWRKGAQRIQATTWYS